MSTASEKSKARELRELTGASYQECLQTIRVLTALGDVDLGALTPLVRGTTSGRRALSVPGIGRPLPATLFGPTVGIDADRPVIASTPPGGERAAETTLFIPLAAPEPDPTQTPGLWFETGDDGEIRPPGTWAIDVADLFRAQRAEAAGQPDLVVPGVPSDVATPIFAGALPHDSYLTELILTAPAAARTPGPGFNWLHLSFTDLDLMSDRPRCDPDCPGGGCGQLHDWPAEDPARRGIVIPAPLLTAYRAIAAELDWDDPLANELRYFRVDDDGRGNAWYGLHTPHFDRVWLGMPTQPAATAAPVW